MRTLAVGVGTVAVDIVARVILAVFTRVLALADTSYRAEETRTDALRQRSTGIGECTRSSRGQPWASAVLVERAPFQFNWSATTDRPLGSGVCTV